MTRYLLDTNILSHLIKEPGGKVARHVGIVGDENVVTSIIVVAEIYYGLVRKRSRRLREQAEAVLSGIRAFPFSEPADERYADIRAGLEARGRQIGANDLLIAAHALALDCILVTDNTREFSRVDSLKIENWLR